MAGENHATQRSVGANTELLGPAAACRPLAQPSTRARCILSIRVRVRAYGSPVVNTHACNARRARGTGGGFPQGCAGEAASAGGHAAAGASTHIFSRGTHFRWPPTADTQQVAQRFPWMRSDDVTLACFGCPPPSQRDTHGSATAIRPPKRSHAPPPGCTALQAQHACKHAAAPLSRVLFAKTCSAF